MPLATDGRNLFDVRSQRRLRTVLGIVAALVAALIVAAPRAMAADVTTQVTFSNITVVSTTPSDGNDPYDMYALSFNYCLPDAAVGGDSFTFTVSNLVTMPTFNLFGPDGTTVIGTAVPTLTGTTTTYKVTFTSNVDGLSNYCGAIRVEGRLGHKVYDSTQTVTVTISSTTSSTDIQTLPKDPIDRTKPRKLGHFLAGTPKRIVWTIELPKGPHAATVPVVDTIPANAGFQFDCTPYAWNGTNANLVGDVYGIDPTTGDTTTWYAGIAPVDPVANPNATPSYPAPPNPGSYVLNSCSPTSINATFPAGGDATHIMRLILTAIVTDPTKTEYTNTATVGGVSVVSTQQQSSGSGTGSGDAIDIEKVDARGNDADTDAAAVKLGDAPAGTGLVFTVKNTGSTALTSVQVTDAALTQNGTVTGLTCNFSQAVAGAPTAGTSWAGPFPSGASFTCHATLSGVAAGATLHGDRATVTATGNGSVSDTDDYWASASNPPYNLTLAKKVTTTAPVHPGEQVTYTLTPHNTGATAAAGWSVTDLLATGTTLVSVTQTGYTCDGAVGATKVTCVAAEPLIGGKDGPVITVTVLVDSNATGQLKNVAYVDKAPHQYDERVPLGDPPTRATDTPTSTTDNDAEATVTLTPLPTPTPTPTVTPTASTPPAPPATPAPTVSPLPNTGGDPLAVPVGLAAMALLMSGAGLVLIGRRRGEV